MHHGAVIFGTNAAQEKKAELASTTASLASQRKELATVTADLGKARSELFTQVWGMKLLHT